MSIAGSLVRDLGQELAEAAIRQAATAVGGAAAGAAVSGVGILASGILLYNAFQRARAGRREAAELQRRIAGCQAGNALACSKLAVDRGRLVRVPLAVRQMAEQRFYQLDAPRRAAQFSYFESLAAEYRRRGLYSLAAFVTSGRRG